MKAITLINNAALASGIKSLSDELDGTYAVYALNRLNSMLDSWQMDGLYIPFVQEITATVTGSPVTIGAGQAINVPLPRFIRNTSFFRSNNNDYPLNFVTEAEFNAIGSKTVNSIPNTAYYDEKFPVGNIYFYPKPAAMELHLIIDSVFPNFTDLTTDYDIGKGYQLAIELSLAELLCIGVRDISPELQRRAYAARRILRQTNQDIPIMQTGLESLYRYRYA